MIIAHKGRLTVSYKNLCIIDGIEYSYVTSTEGEESPFTVIEEGDPVRALIKEKCPLLKGIDMCTAKRIAARYSTADELKALRMGKGSPEFEEYNAYVEECVAWGRAEKAKFGL